MSDPIDQARERLAHVEVPNRWDEIVARAAVPGDTGADFGTRPVNMPPRRTRGMVMWGTAAAAAVVALTVGTLAIRSGPAIAPGSTDPPATPTSATTPPDDTVQPGNTTPTEPAPVTSTTSAATTTTAATTNTTAVVNDQPMWRRPCTDVSGTADSNPADEFSSQTFGPLDHNPGIQIV
ncbi:MAG TPA: hypothetical protein PLV68_06055, partial [Ilumatobacteraceae bacterium]|nr:hypothetical protein [Ilumatobacteraceae bacterium]